MNAVFDARDEARVKRTRLVRFAVINLGLIATGATSRADPCAVQVSLGQHIAQAYPGWRPVLLSDLTPDDQRLFLADHAHSCPGQVTLDFFGDPLPAVALSLWKSGQALLVLARPTSPSAWSLQVLDDANEPAVVWKEAAGEFEDAYKEKRLRVAREGLVWCGYESWAILYAWVNGAVEKIWLSD